MDPDAVKFTDIDNNMGAYNDLATIPSQCVYCNNVGVEYCDPNGPSAFGDDVELYQYYACELGSCVLIQPIVGCTDTSAVNYHSLASVMCDSSNQSQYQIADINDDFYLADILNIGTCVGGEINLGDIYALVTNFIAS